MSCILYHGPAARQEALNQAHRIGRLLVPPVGDEGLKIDEVRGVVELLLSTPVGMHLGVVVVGPMDRATPKASDGLLKGIEEDHDVVQPILWAHDLGEVSPTIRSRCLARWCPKAPSLEDSPIEEDGRQLAMAALAHQYWKIAPLVKKYNNKDCKRLGDLVAEVVGVLAENPTAEALSLWDSLREVLQYHNPQTIEVIAALLGRGAE